MKIAVIGTGYVGLTVVCLADYGHEIFLLGRDKAKAEAIGRGFCPIYEPGLEAILERNVKKGLIHSGIDYSVIKECEIVLICVGTPARDDGSIDLSQIQSASEGIAKQLNDNKYRVVCVKSTVVPKTTKDFVIPILEKFSGKKAGKDFGVCMNPEFLKEGYGVEDFVNPDKIVIGALDEKSYEIFSKIYADFVGKTHFVKTDLNTAEMIKYAQNSALATRISFINEIANICEQVAVDVKDVAKAIGLDKRIGPKFLNAGIGFGGSCFPKDVKALVFIAKAHGIEPKILSSVLDVNKNQPSRVNNLLKESLKNLHGKNIGVLGLAFKDNTDDMRDSASIPIISSLVEEGANVIAYDPKAVENAKQIFGNKITYAKTIEEVLNGNDATLILTEWGEFKNIDYSNVKLIIDGRRILDPATIPSNAVYKGIGWRNN